MYLEQLQENWNTFGEEDAMWAVCSSYERKHNKWDKQDFFQSGVRRIAKLAAWMDEHGLPKSRKTALDFGCGVGRLTQALCDHFDLCVGVDIAPSMIRQAKEHNRFGKRCVYRLNETDNLGAFPSATFDHIYTEHVLQHIHPRIAIRYIAEFVRVLKPGGLAYFHCPSALATFAYPEGGICCTLDTDAVHLSMEHRSSAVVPVRVTNTGGHPIGMSPDINAPAKIWHHWHNAETGEAFWNHGYTNLPVKPIAPGETIEIEYRAASPAAPGRYTLLLTPANYFNAPLSDDPADAITLDVDVQPRTGAAPEGNEKKLKAKRPKSESHAIPVEVVTGTVESAGGRVVEAIHSQQYPGSVARTDYYVTR